MLLGFLLGSSAAISFGLLGVALIFWLLGPDEPRLAGEIGPLLGHLVRFLLLTLAAGTGFYGLMRQRPWRRAAIGVLVLVLTGLIVSYWPAGL